MDRLKYFLLPFSFIYFLITSFRNFLYDCKIWVYRPLKFDVFTISVGNLSVGGTGKTPHIEYLIRLLYDQYKVATLSRGYGRDTRGVIIADEHATASEIGDEPMQFHAKFYPKIHVTVGEERSVAIPHLLYTFPETQVVLLDDCFQHRKVLPDINILLTDYHNLFFKDFLLPVGRLRESRNGAQRADIVIVTKCPDDIGYRKEYIKIKFRKYINTNKIPVFYTGIRYTEPMPGINKSLVFDKEADILLVTGIASAKLLKQYVSDNFRLHSTIAYNDHHKYTESNFNEMYARFIAMPSMKKCILTTEKDIVKWTEFKFKKGLPDVPVFFVPIEIYFLENEDAFKSFVFKSLK